LLAAAEFQIFGADHLAALLVSAAVGAWIIARGRRDGPRGAWTLGARRTLAWVQIVNQLVWHGRKVWAGDWSPADSLPLHLCDGAVIVTVLALLYRRPILTEIAYLWALAGALQACITPDITEGFPSYFYWQFFLTHAGLVICALFLVVSCRDTPRPGAWWRGWLATNAWAVLAALGNLAFGGNYMFLDHPPPTGSLLDELGPWPWYIVSAQGVTLASFALLLLPFKRRRV